MEEDGDDWTPFWLENATNTRRTDRLRQSISSVLFSSGMVVILLLITTSVFFFGFVVPTTVSFIAQIFRPNSVKKSWDSLNIVLVVVGAMFGFLNKITNEERVDSDYYDESQPSPNIQNEVKKSPTKASTSDQWYNNYNKFKGQTANNASSSSSNQRYGSPGHHKDSTLRRNSSSYPDLRESSSNSWDHDRRVPDMGHRHRRHRSMEEVEILKAPPPPPPPQTQTIFTDTLSQSREETQRLPRTIRIPDQAPLRSPPPPPPQKNTSVDDFFNSFYHKKKKKSPQKSVDDLNSFFHQPQSPLNFQIPQPPPPPPPPPPPQDLFNLKKHKRKRSIITVPVTVTPPLNPNSQIPPPKIINTKSFDIINEISNGGVELPPPPPPPPPPPGLFKTPVWKFVAEGDYVRVNSISSESPDPDDVEDSDVMTDAVSFHASPLLFYSSSDVNGKAERFIGNFRSKLKLEKNYSLDKNKVGLSSLGR